MPLTDAEIRSFIPRETHYRRSDGHGLFLEVMPTGKTIFRLAYRIGGAQRTASIGTYPATSLADARLKMAAYKITIKEGMPTGWINRPSVANRGVAGLLTAT